MAGKVLKDRRLWIITIAVFILLLSVFDKNNLLDRWKLNKSIYALEQQRDYFLERIAEDSTLIENLKNDQFLERYAREHFLMKRDNEQIYIINVSSTDL